MFDPDMVGSALLRGVLEDADIRARFVESWPELERSRGAALVVANYDLLDGPARERLLGGSPGRLLLYSSDVVRPEFSEVFGRWRVANIVAMPPELDPTELTVTIRKLVGGSIFGIDQYFSRASAAVSFTIERSDRRGDALERIAEFARLAGARGRLAALFVTVADELLTNALYNAPVDGAGNPRHAHLSRTEEIALGEGESIAVELRADGVRAGISVGDPFGALSAERILEHLSKCFRRGHDQVDDKAGGAGLGFYQAFEAVSHLAFNLAPGIRTEAVGIVNVRGSYREFAARGKSFNIFVGGPP